MQLVPSLADLATELDIFIALFFGLLSRGGGGTLRISGCGCTARTLEPLAYTRASFSWILLPYNRVNSWFLWSSQPTGQFREK